jgi:hypothetical protein
MKKIQYNVSYIKGIWSKLIKTWVNNYNLPKIIREVLKHSFHDRWHNETKLEKSGIYNSGLDNDETGRSLLNYMDTNYITFTVLINWINNEIYHNRIHSSQIDFYNNEWNIEIIKFFNIFYYNRKYIFENYGLIQEIIKIIINTTKKGTLAENKTIDELKKKGISKIIHHKKGYKEDIVNGIDIIFWHNDKKYTIQTKYFTDMSLSNGVYMFKGSVMLRNYKDIDFLSLYNRESGFYMFTNDINQIIVKNTFLYIPEELKRNI